MIADVELSDVRHLDDARLSEVTASPTRVEREISAERTAVQHVLERYLREPSDFS